MLYLSGDFFGTTEERELFHAEIDSVIEAGGRRVILDISRTKLISSTGIGLIVAVYKKLSAHDGRIAVAHPSDSMKPLLEAFDWPVKCFASHEEAIASFDSDD